VLHEASPGALAREQRFTAFDDAVSETIGAVNASVARLVELVRDCQAESIWRDAGCRSAEHWLQTRCALGAALAHKVVRIAAGIGEFPAIGAQARQGLVTIDHLDVVVRDANPATDDELAACVPWVNVRQLRRVIADLPRRPAPEETDDTDDADADAEPKPKPPVDEFGFGWGDDGRLRGRFDLGPQTGSVLEKALRAARARLFRERTGADPETEGAAVESISWADSLERLAHGALRGLDPAFGRGERPGERYQVIVHIDLDDPDLGRLHLGRLLPRSVTDELTCDADLRAVLERHGIPLASYARQRVVDPKLRALIEDRDRGCRLCGAHGFLHIHHIVHWTKGGPTITANLIAVCTSCHRAIHRGDIHVSGNPDDPDGLQILDGNGRPPPRPGPRPTSYLPEAPQAYGGPDRRRWTSQRFGYWVPSRRWN